jgi:hypothetical protein
MSLFRANSSGASLKSYSVSILAGTLLFAVLGAQAFGQDLVSISVAQVKEKSEGGIALGTARQFTATGTYSDNSTKYLTQSVTWTSADPNIAPVSQNMGLVTGVAVGSANITASLNGIEGSSTAQVVAVPISRVVVTPAKWTVRSGTMQQFNATATFGANAIQDVTSGASWSSSNTSVATVSSSGLVTAVGAGTAKIKATYSGKSGKTPLTVTVKAPANLGQWSAPQYLGMVPVHAAMLHTGKVLLFGYPDGHAPGPSAARLFDSVTNATQDVTLPFPIDIFCAGQSVMPDGRVLVDGGLDDEHYPGHAGITNTTLFDPISETWSAAAPMTYSRWYPTTLVTPGGSILAVTGTQADGKTITAQIESYDPTSDTWTVLPPSANVPNAQADYPLLIVLKNGKIFYPGPRQDSQMFDPISQSWSYVSSMNFGTRFHSMAVLLPKSEKVMIVGGAITQPGDSPTNTTEIIDFSAQRPAWVYGPPLHIKRYNENLLYLPDGTLIAIGGGQHTRYGNPVFKPELFDPVANTWRLLPPQVGVRAYHSIAVLMPDGRVISAGSDSSTSFQYTYEIYSPSYLFKGPRPTITSSPGDAQYGQQFNIQTPDFADITRVALLRPTATTHANHMDDNRYIDLSFHSKSGSLTVTAPQSSNHAPPGYYMLVILNSKGVPAVMPFLNLHQ